MLKVLPIQSKLQQEQICLKCNVTYQPDLLAYAAYDDNRLLGVCQFRLSAEGGMISDLANAEGENHFEALFLMGRGTLNFIDLCGVKQAYYIGPPIEERILLAVGFQKNDQGRYFVNLEGFFTNHHHNP